MPPAARVGDETTHGTPLAPGPGAVTVLIGGMPAWRAMVDQHICPAVNVTGADGVGSVMLGSPTVLIDGQMACRLGDIVVEKPGLAMGPVNPIILGEMTVMIGEVGMGGSIAISTPDAVDLDEGASAAAVAGKPTAAQADKSILDKFGSDIPKAAKSPSAASVTVLQSDSDFKDAIKKRHPNIEKSHDVDAIFGESYKKQIFINKDKDYSGTLYHEALHHYTDKNFTKKLHKYKGVAIEEGVTEYFTRQIKSDGRDGHYDSERDVAEKIAKGVGEDTLKKAYFQGDEDSIKKVQDFLDAD